MIESLALVIKEEEQFVLHDGAADGSPEHVPPQRRPGERLAILINPLEAVLPLIGVQLVIAEVFEDVAMETIGPRFDGCADDAALKIPELSRCVVGDEVKFLDRVRRWC